MAVPYALLPSDGLVSARRQRPLKPRSEGAEKRYLTPIEHEIKSAWASGQPKDLYLGEDEFFAHALDGREPESSIRKREWSKCVESISSKLPKLPEALQDTVASAVSLVKVEAEFNWGFR